MAKKNLSLGRSYNEYDILGYRLPRFHKTDKSAYVDYYVKDCHTGRKKRFKLHLEKYTSPDEQQLHANLLIAKLSEKLIHGWNPTQPELNEVQHIKITEALDRYIADVRKRHRATTKHNYLSRVKILKEYNEKRDTPITYCTEYTKGFITGFL